MQIYGVSKENFLAFGGDSFVFRENHAVRKYYNGGPFCSPLSGEQIHFYQTITNKAAQKVWTIAGLPPVHVNSVNSVEWDTENNCWTSMSSKINGQRAIEFYNKETIREVRKKLSLLNEKMNQELDVIGIEISDGNVMVLDGIFYVTDLAMSVKGVKQA